MKRKQFVAYLLLVALLCFSGCVPDKPKQEKGEQKTLATQDTPIPREFQDQVAKALKGYQAVDTYLDEDGFTFPGNLDLTIVSQSLDSVLPDKILATPFSVFQGYRMGEYIDTPEGTVEGEIYYLFVPTPMTGDRTRETRLFLSAMTREVADLYVADSYEKAHYDPRLSGHIVITAKAQGDTSLAAQGELFRYLIGVYEARRGMRSDNQMPVLNTSILGERAFEKYSEKRYLLLYLFPSRTEIPPDRTLPEFEVPNIGGEYVAGMYEEQYGGSHLQYAIALVCNSDLEFWIALEMLREFYSKEYNFTALREGDPEKLRILALTLPLTVLTEGDGEPLDEDRLQ